MQCLHIFERMSFETHTIIVKCVNQPMKRRLTLCCIIISLVSLSLCTFDFIHSYLPLGIDGMDVVDKIETVGSGSGATAAKVVIKECGELIE
jgi:hypothetical protein